MRCLTILRVISGSAKRHKLKTLKNNIARPTADRVKESLFGIISSYVNNANVLDLYAGTGSLGIESLSRGAKSATFVEINNLCCSIIKQNLIATNFYESSHIIKSNAIKWINKQDSNLIAKFDLIFMDPPYKDDVLFETLIALGKTNIMTNNCYLVAESSKNYIFKSVDRFELIRESKYGDTKLSHFNYRYA